MYRTKKKIFKFQIIAILLLILGIVLIGISQLPYGYAFFTDVLVGIGTGFISGFIFLSVTGVKEREKYTIEDQLALVSEVQEKITRLFQMQYDIPRNREDRKRLYLKNEKKMIGRVENWFRSFTVLVTSLACNMEYREFIVDITKDNLNVDINEWFNDLNGKIIEINKEPVLNVEMAEELYEHAKKYFDKIAEIHFLLIKMRSNIQINKESIAKSII